MTDQVFLETVRDFHLQQGNDELAAAVPEDTSTYNRHKNGTKPKGKPETKRAYLKALADFLQEHGYWPFDQSMEQAAEALCAFFGVAVGSRSSKILPELIGQYRCFQRSSWHHDHVQISTFSFTASPKDSRPHLLVTEQQATGPKVADELGLVETVENFAGVAFPRENMLYMTLREERQQRPKFCLIYQILPDSEERPAMYLQGITLKGSKGPNNRLHLSRMIMERLTPPVQDSEEEVEQIQSDDDLGDHRPHLMSAKDFRSEHPRYFKRLFEVPLTDY